jgi:hypothetical protein
VPARRPCGPSFITLFTLRELPFGGVLYPIGALFSLTYLLDKTAWDGHNREQMIFVLGEPQR